MIFSILNAFQSSFIKRSHRLQRHSPLRDVALWGLEVNANNHIAVDGVDAVGLLEQYGSPLLVVNKKQLIEDAARIRDAMSLARPGSKVLYSYKTNCIPGVLAEIHKLGIGAEVISPFELWLAQQLGNSGESIVFNGPAKTEESLRRALEVGALSVNVDYLEEIDKLLALRPRSCNKIRVGVRLGLVPDSQLGLDMESGEAMQVCRRIAASPELFEFTGVHFNVVSNARHNSFHRTCLFRALDFILQIKEQTGLKTSYLNLGGGYGVPTTKVMSRSEYALYRLFGALPKAPNPARCQAIGVFIRELVNDVRTFCQQTGLDELKLLLEPGRYITSRCQFLLTRVNAIKKKHSCKQYAMTDAGKLSITYPCDYEYHEMFVANRVHSPLTTSYTVVGRTCTAADWIAKNRCLPMLQAGDVLAVMDAGAYFVSYSTNFSFPRPAIVMISDGEVRCIRQAETFSHMVAMDVGLTNLEASGQLQERMHRDDLQESFLPPRRV